MTIYNFIKLSKNFLVSNRLLKLTFINKAARRLIPGKYDLKVKKSGFIKHVDIDQLKTDYYRNDAVREICERYLRHQFHFLGTGWICWNEKNNIAGKTESYDHIAWDKDMISSYQFTQRNLSSDLIPSLPKGVDIKRPWELGRMNHFPFLVMCALNNEDLRTAVLKEFTEQVKDLILHSPIGVGVQYYCPMDVGIRCINLLLSYDILRQLDSEGVFTQEFLSIFENYILAQGKYIAHNLEYNFVNQASGNHFLCDICGLLWICAYFDNKISVRWYKSCKKIFYKEIEKQFLPGGSNYECSSGYHRLSCEIVAMGLIAMEWKDGNLDCSNSIMKRLVGMGELLDLLRGCDGNIIQIGDMDSGYILKLMPHYMGDNENTLSVDYVLGLLDGLTIRQRTNRYSIDYCLALQMLKGFTIKGIAAEGADKSAAESISVGPQDAKAYENFIAASKHLKQWDCLLEAPGSVLRILSNTEFGLIKVIYEHADLYIRVMPDYAMMDLSHVHDDVFHFEIVYPTYRWHPDSGSINYTENVEMRNYYAKNQSHNTVIHSIPIVSRIGVFVASSIFQGGMCIKGGVLYLYAEGPFKHVRKFVICEALLSVTDASDDYFEVNIKDNSYSFGYGQIPKSMER